MFVNHSQKKRFWLSISLMAVAYVLFMMSLIGSAELEGKDDYQHITVAAAASWGQILKPLFLGRLATIGEADKTWLYSADVVDHSFTSRVGQTLTTKIMHTFFGSDPIPYIFMQILVGAACLVLLAWLVLQLTSSYALALFAGFFYFFFPPALLHNVWLSDTAEFVHLFTLSAFALLYYKYRQKQSMGWTFKKRDVWLGGVLLFIALFAYKTKPSGVIVPVMFGVSYLFYLWRWRAVQWLTLVGFVAGLCLMLFAPELLENLFSQFKIEHILNMVFMNTVSDGELESKFTLFDLSSVVPVSLARNVNFFLLWLTLLSSAYLLLKRKYHFRTETVFILIWFLVEVLCYAIGGNRTRYLTDAMVPLIILMSILFKHTWNHLDMKGARYAFGTIFIVGFCFHGINNFQHLKFLRKIQVGYLYELNKSTQVIYNDLHGLALGTMNPAQNMVSFNWPSFVQQTRKKALPNFLGVEDEQIYLPDLLAFSDVGDLYKSEFDPLTTESLFKKHGILYGVSYSATPPDKHFKLVTSIPRVPHSPMLSFFRKFKSKKKPVEHIYIYKRTN